MSGQDTRCVHARRSGWNSSIRCRNNGTVTRNGRLYCHIHDPDKADARRASREARWDAKNKQYDNERAKKAAFERIADAAIVVWKNGREFMPASIVAAVKAWKELP